VKDDVPVDSETLLITEFVNLKIKSTQSFECVYRDKVFMRESTHTCMSIYVCAVFFEEKTNELCSLFVSFGVHPVLSTKQELLT
jgi:hypothetical protein